MEDAQAAIDAGDFAGARAVLEAVLAGGEVAHAHELLAGVCLVLGDIPAGQGHGEAAYHLYQQAGNPGRAAAAAMAVADLQEWQGHDGAVRGWLGRAARQLDQAGPCVEHGYLELARAGHQVQDVGALEASADLAVGIAREFHDRDLEARALADGGLALVCQGRVEDGLARLDQAMAAVMAGAVSRHLVAVLTCGAMLTACERLGDIDRAVQWFDAMGRNSSSQILKSHCRLVHGRLLATHGDRVEAEAEFRRALELTEAVPRRAAARAGIAELCLQQNRFSEAEELLDGFEERPEAAAAMTRLHLARGEVGLAAATLERALLDVESDLLSSAPLLALHVETEIERGDLDMAATSAARIRWIAIETGVPTLAALGRLSSGRVAAARGAVDRR